MLQGAAAFPLFHFNLLEKRQDSFQLYNNKSSEVFMALEHAKRAHKIDMLKRLLTETIRGRLQSLTFTHVCPTRHPLTHLTSLPQTCRRTLHSRPSSTTARKMPIKHNTMRSVRASDCSGLVAFARMTIELQSVKHVARTNFWPGGACQ
eukprot:scaffold11487_cov18-Tisochrysis_lutea.AAC.4